jgi:hypothetical protein
MAETSLIPLDVFGENSRSGFPFVAIGLQVPMSATKKLMFTRDR